MAPISVQPVQASVAGPKADAMRKAISEDTATDFPPWRTVLEDCIKKNYREGAGDVQVSMATIRPFGRPANRIVNYTGFMTDSPSGGTTETHTSKPVMSGTTAKPLNDAHGKLGVGLSSFLAELMGSNEYDSALVEAMTGIGARMQSEPQARLNEAMVFAVDARSKVVEDVLFGSRFTEICWSMPRTPDQFRLSGTLHLILPPTHPLYGTHQLPPPMPATSPTAIDWEAKRQSTWASLPEHRRKILSHPSLVNTTSGPEAPRRIVRRFSIVESYPSEMTGAATTGMSAEPEELSPDEETKDNLALLVLEVDGVDHLDGAGARTKYRRTVGADGQVEDDVNPYEGKMRKVKHWLLQEMVV